MTVSRLGGWSPTVLRAAVCLTALSSLVGCNGVTPSSDPAAPSVYVPVFTPVADCQPTQFRGGLSITVTPITYAVQQRTQLVAVTGGPVAQQLPDGTYGPVPQQVQQASVPVLQVMPDRFAFAVTIGNDTEHVFRSRGAVAQLSAYNQPLAAGPADFTGFADLVLLPRNQQQILVFGPPLRSVAPNTPITLTLYDVVTATDPAGNPTVRERLSWTFNYQVQTQTLAQLQQAGPPQVVVDQYDPSAGPTYVVVPVGVSVGSPPPRPRPQPRPQAKPKTAPPAVNAVDTTAAPASQPATPPKKKRKNG